MADSSDYKEMQMQLALEACRQVADPNYSAIAREFPPTDRHTLRRRFEGIQTSRREAHSIHHQNLSIEEEEQLIITINKLTARGLPPTSQMVRNLAEEMISRAVGKNWTRQFVKRHQNRLESIYLRNIDNMQTQSEYAPMIKLFFDLV
jgi:Tc5 transposase DNA-binding domain